MPPKKKTGIHDLNGPVTPAKKATTANHKRKSGRTLADAAAPKVRTLPGRLR